MQFNPQKWIPGQIQSSQWASLLPAIQLETSALNQRCFAILDAMAGPQTPNVVATTKIEIQIKLKGPGLKLFHLNFARYNAL